MLGVEQLRGWWDDVFTHADPRVGDLPMLNSIMWPLGVTGVYLILVCLGPSFMKNRQAMELRSMMVLYNFAMVALSGYMVVEFLLSGWLYYSLGCEPLDTSMSPRALRMISVYYIFYVSKIIELLDTMFFILRKKFSQMSFLHVFHHALLPLTIWLGLRFAPGGACTLTGLLNSFVHFLMYFYYGLAALGPEYRKYLWWKRYMTAAQITQFIIIVVHSSQLFVIECNYPIFFAYVVVVEGSIFFVLFSHYWFKEFRQKKSRKME